MMDQHAMMQMMPVLLPEDARDTRRAQAAQVATNFSADASPAR